MKKQLFSLLVATVTMLALPKTNFAQAPNLGTAANYALFTSVGSVTNSGITYLTRVTGNVGTNSAPTITGFGNVDGVMSYTGSLMSAKCASDLLAASDSLAKVKIDSTLGLVIGGYTLRPGNYLMPGAASLNGNLTLDAKGNSNAVFILVTAKAFSSTANSRITLKNGAMACNVFWKLDGAVSIGTSNVMRGTIISGSAISLGVGDTLEGRALTTNGAVMCDSLLAYTPIGCSSPTLTGPAFPPIGSTSCYGVFSGNGSVSNFGNTYVTGDVGTNVGLTTGYNASNVTGTIHPKPDGSTAACAKDLATFYNYLDSLKADIQLLYPAQFGHSLVLTPHVYIMKSAVTFVDTVYLNAENNANAVFVIQVNGAFSTGAFAKVKLINGAQAKNVFWMINGAVSLATKTVFVGTIVGNNGAIGLHSSAVTTGGVFTTDGQLTTDTNNITNTTTCVPAGIESINGNAGHAILIYPNPFNTSLTITVFDMVQNDTYQVSVYDVLGKMVMNKTITEKTTVLATTTLPSGMYFYQVLDNNILLQSGKVISAK